MKSNAYIRARICVLRELIKSEPEDLLRFFRNGYFPEGYDEKELIEKKMQDQTFSNEALSMTELCSFSSYFSMYPEKIAGKEVQTTSTAFPIKVKGSIQDIKQCMKEHDSEDLSILELEAEAVIIALGLGINI